MDGVEALSEINKDYFGGEGVLSSDILVMLDDVGNYSAKADSVLFPNDGEIGFIAAVPNCSVCPSFYTLWLRINFSGDLTKHVSIPRHNVPIEKNSILSAAEYLLSIVPAFWERYEEDDR